MKIYIDLVMILNFLIDFVLLLVVSIILKRNTSINKIMLGSFFGGISIIFLFLNINSIELFLFKVIISILMTIISFNYKNFKYTINNIICLYIVSILLGGFLYYLNIEFSYKHIGIIFFNKGLSINYIFLIIISPIILYVYIKQIKKFKYNYSNYYNIVINIDNNDYKYIGYMDTGNILKDPLTHKPVILIDKRKILFDIKEYRMIPYTTVSGQSIIKVIKIDSLKYKDKIYENILLGIMDNIKIEGIDVILNRYLEE